MSMQVFDPTTSPEREAIDFVPRPKKLEGLRVGLVENTKFNSKTLLVKIGERLQSRHNIEVVNLTSKRSPSHGVEEEAVREIKTKADFAIAGIGD